MRNVRLSLAVTALVLATVLVACGDDDGGGDGSAEGGEQQETVTLTVGVIPIADVAPLYLGVDQGFFEEENLEIKTQLAEGGAAIIPSVLNGDYQIGFSNTTSLIIAGSKDLPIQIISQGVLGGTGPDDAWDGVLVPANSDIKELKDLEGKTVAVNTLNNVSQVVINTALKEAGADHEKVNYVEVPFPEMNAALEAGRVDAAFQVEPGYTGGLAAGSTNILNAYEEMATNYTVATYFASKQYIGENREIVDRFVRAMEKSLEYAAENDDEVRAIVGTYTKIPEEVLDTMNLPVWKPDLNEDTIELTIDAADEYGFIEEKPSLDDLILRD
jgi:NitT/TauT family transport system substrate-binding protein